MSEIFIGALTGRAKSLIVGGRAVVPEPQSIDVSGVSLLSLCIGPSPALVATAGSG